MTTLKQIFAYKDVVQGWENAILYRQGHGYSTKFEQAQLAVYKEHLDKAIKEYDEQYEKINKILDKLTNQDNQTGEPHDIS